MGTMDQPTVPAAHPALAVAPRAKPEEGACTLSSGTGSVHA